MIRRKILQLGLAGAASPLLLPNLARAEQANMMAPVKDMVVQATPSPFTSPFAGSLFYTTEKPGRWQGKEAGHAPTIVRKDNNMIEVTTGHEMNDYVHYIVKHMIFDEHFNFVSEKLFDPLNDAAISEHDISHLKNMVYAVSVCNKHDAWVSALAL